MNPILTYQDLISHVDGSLPCPPNTITVENKVFVNPEFMSWVSTDQRCIIILQASLSEEAITVIVGMTTAHQIWAALEKAYGNSSIGRVHNLRDQLFLIQKGTKFVAEFGRAFKSLCDQLAAIGFPVDEDDQLHWFLCGLGLVFETFSTTVRSTRHAPSFADLLAMAESHKLFIRALHHFATPAVAFNANSGPPVNASGNCGGHGPYRGGNNGGSHSGRGNRGGRRSPHCQLCRTNGHYANVCPNLKKFAVGIDVKDNDLASAFLSQCHVTSPLPDWFVDSGATDYMNSTTQSVFGASSAIGNKSVTFGNGKSLLVTHKGHSILNNHIRLNDILVVPNLTHNLLSISKLTKDNSVDVLLSYPSFSIQDCHTKQVLASGSCENGLYVLHPSYQAFVSQEE